jgi:phage terminase large subunit-like protein
MAKVKPLPLTRAGRIIAFISRYCRVPEGALVGQPIKLAAFQTDFIRKVYDNPAGTRRAYLSIARKNSKTATIACLVLAHLVGPEAQQNSRINSGAMSRKQAAEVFNYAAKIVQLSPDLSALVHIQWSAKRLTGLAMNVEYEALSAEASTAVGGSPILAILDEVGQIRGPSSSFVDAIVTAQGAHAAPLLIAISTQARSDSDLFSVWLDDGLTGEDPQIISVLYAAPEDCDLMDQDAWAAANPALDLFRSREDLALQAGQAHRAPSQENAFRNLCLNQRIEAQSPLISRGTWLSCSGGSGLIEGERIYLGLDLALVNDLAALVAVSADDGDRVESWFWKPGDLVADQARRDRAPYDVWVKQGWLQAPPGKIVSHAVIAQKIIELSKRFEVVALAYDRWRIENVLAEFERLEFSASDQEGASGLRIAPWGQGFRDMSPAIDAFESAAVGGTLRHNDNPVLSMCVANAIVSVDPAGNRKLDKGKSASRIDGAVALAMAIGIKARERTGEVSSMPEIIIL